MTLNENPNFNPNLSNEDRKKLINKAFVRTQHLQNIIDDIKESRNLAKEGDYEEQPDSILIVGESGVGKTELLKRYVGQSPRYIEENDFGDQRDIVPVLSVSLPDDASGRAAPIAILHALGGEADDPKGIRSVLKTRFSDRAKDSKIELIVIDEFHHAISRITTTQLKLASDWVKNIINQTNIPIVLMGLPICLDIMEKHKELKNRFPITHQMARYNLEDIKEWQSFLKKLDRSLGFRYLSGFEEPDLALRLLALTGGLLTTLMKWVIRPAARRALEEGSEFVPLEHLIEVSSKRLKLQLEDNPLSKQHFSRKNVLSRIQKNERELKATQRIRDGKISDVF